MVETSTQLFNNLRGFTASLGFWWSIVLVPIWQELLFRYVPYRFFYLPTGQFWLVGIVFNILFAAIHWYFGRWFILYAFVLGMIAWWVMVRFGLVAVILLHAVTNIALWYFGLSKILIR